MLSDVQLTHGTRLQLWQSGRGISFPAGDNITSRCEMGSSVTGGGPVWEHGVVCGAHSCSKLGQSRRVQILGSNRCLFHSSTSEIIWFCYYSAPTTSGFDRSAFKRLEGWKTRKWKTCNTTSTIKKVVKTADIRRHRREPAFIIMNAQDPGWSLEAEYFSLKWSEV